MLAVPTKPALLAPRDWRARLSFEAAAASDGLGWVSLEAERVRAAPPSQISQPAMTHHMLILYIRPPEELDVSSEEINRHVRPAIGSISVAPAGRLVRWRWSGSKDVLHVYLEPSLVARVAAEAFDLDPARLTIPPLTGVEIPQLRAAMGAVDAELTAGGAGGPLAAESLANVLAVHLLRHVLAPRRPERGRDGTLPLLTGVGELTFQPGSLQLLGSIALRANFVKGLR